MTGITALHKGIGIGFLAGVIAYGVWASRQGGPRASGYDPAGG